VFKGLPRVDSLSRDEEFVSISTGSDFILADNDLTHFLLSPQLFSQGEINDLARYFNLYIESSELLASTPKHILKPAGS